MEIKPVLDFIYKKWPRVKSYIPENVIPINPYSTIGLCSHPDLINKLWVRSTGNIWFTNETIPNNFFWIGIRNGGGSEYFFLMWYKNNRRFWFYDQYAVYYADSNNSPKQTLENINSALDRWTSTTDDVIYGFEAGFLQDLICR